MGFHGDPNKRLTKEEKHSPLYRVWAAMKSRCSNPKVSNYARYGGRGIRVCDEWKDNFKTFRAWAFANGYERGLSIDRYPDNNGNYEPSNCRWATDVQQIANRSTTKLIEFCGETLTAAQWSKRLGMPKSTIEKRIARGVAPENALVKFTPKHPGRSIKC